MKIALYLMTQKGFEVLNALLENHLQAAISEVIVGRDKNIEDDFADKIIELCRQNNIKCIERTENAQTEVDYSIAIAWRWLISANNSNLIVLHDSLLPKYRGFAPLVNMLINNENELGVSAIFASEEYDKGDIIAQTSTKIKYPITIAQAIDIVSKNYIELVVNIVDSLSKGAKISAVSQNEKLATYSLWRDEEDYFINWNNSANQILNFINAVSSPYKGAAAFINGVQKIRILAAQVEEDVQIENRDVGKVIFVKDKFPVIVCGSGLIKLLRVTDDNAQEEMLPLKNFRVKLSAVKKI